MSAFWDSEALLLAIRKIDLALEKATIIDNATLAFCAARYSDFNFRIEFREVFAVRVADGSFLLTI